ncbi:MAG: hypothetical protein COX63_01530, partial [Candidatus Diapherotrites archaeon CG_4_10_14_0_2_um_filter_31_5]
MLSGVNIEVLPLGSIKTETQFINALPSGMAETQKKRLYEIYEERLKHSNRKKPAELLIFAGCLLHGMKTKRTILPFSKVELELKKLFNLKIKTTDGKFIKDLAEELKIFSEIEKREIVDAVTG